MDGKRKAGRPKKADAQKKLAGLTLRIHRDVKADIERVADAMQTNKTDVLLQGFELYKDKNNL